MRIGTKSLIFGAHQFLLHPLFVALAWWKLYSFPTDPRLWAAFFLHDIGYWSSPDMDGEIGQRHPERGARVMTRLFDTPGETGDMYLGRTRWGRPMYFGHWGQLSLFHSRYYARALNQTVSPLAAADKLATALVPLWLYRLQVLLTGEWREYVAFSRADGFIGPDDGFMAWSRKLQAYFRAEAYRIKAELEAV